MRRIITALVAVVVVSLTVVTVRQSERNERLQRLVHEKNVAVWKAGYRGPDVSVVRLADQTYAAFDRADGTAWTSRHWNVTGGRVIGGQGTRELRFVVDMPQRGASVSLSTTTSRACAVAARS